MVTLASYSNLFPFYPCSVVSEAISVGFQKYRLSSFRIITWDSDCAETQKIVLWTCLAADPVFAKGSILVNGSKDMEIKETVRVNKIRD